MAKRNALGKGLGALIPVVDETSAEKITSETTPSPMGLFLCVALDRAIN